jgi:CO/xanthine dehydrogenase FAD-binding subunit
MLGARSSDQAVEVVDLQALGLGTFEPAGDGGLRIGATVTLQQLADHAAAPPVVREAAHRERPSTLRNQATVGGVIASGDAESELLAALLAHDAVVTLVSAGAVDDRPLGAVLAGLPLPRGLLVSSVTVATGGRAAAARTARTTADTPIVVAIARADGGAPRVALAGVAPRPVVVTAVDDLDPPGDFRGSGEYRAELARVLTARVVEALR